MEDLERRLVARQAKLSPKLHGRHAGCLAGHQIGRPKPYAQRRVRARHDRSTVNPVSRRHLRQRKTPGRFAKRNGSPPPDNGGKQTVAPASLLQVGGAGRVVGKKSLELWERLWEPKIATLVNVHEHGRTLPLVAVGDNRIGKDRGFRIGQCAAGMVSEYCRASVDAHLAVIEQEVRALCRIANPGQHGSNT